MSFPYAAIPLVGLAALVAYEVYEHTKGKSVQKKLEEASLAYTAVGPNGEHVFNTDAAHTILQQLGGMTYSYADGSHQIVEVHVEPKGRAVAPALAATQWASAQNRTMSILAPLYMATPVEPGTRKFLRAVPPGQEALDGYGVILYAGCVAARTPPPGSPSAPGQTPRPSIAVTPLLSAHEEAPEEILREFQSLLVKGQDPVRLRIAAAHLERAGKKRMAALLRSKAANLETEPGISDPHRRPAPPVFRHGPPRQPRTTFHDMDFNRPPAPPAAPSPWSRPNPFASKPASPSARNSNLDPRAAQRAPSGQPYDPYASPASSNYHDASYMDPGRPPRIPPRPPPETMVGPSTPSRSRVPKPSASIHQPFDFKPQTDPGYGDPPKIPAAKAPPSAVRIAPVRQSSSLDTFVTQAPPAWQLPVKEVQDDLIILALLPAKDPSTGKPTNDGWRGHLTDKALKAFQVQSGLPGDGVVDGATAQTLHISTNEHIDGARPGLASQAVTLAKKAIAKLPQHLPDWTNGPTSAPPGWKADARTVQQLLVIAGLLQAAQVSGIVDAPTRAAVLAFQKRAHLGQDGVVGNETLQALHDSTHTVVAQALPVGGGTNAAGYLDDATAGLLKYAPFRPTRLNVAL